MARKLDSKKPNVVPWLLGGGVVLFVLIMSAKASAASSTSLPEGEGAAGGGDGGGGGGGGGSGGSSRSTRPPNVSGDPAGYDTKLWPTGLPVRLGLNVLGYKISAMSAPLSSAGDMAVVKTFQADWNSVVAGVASKKVPVPPAGAKPVYLASIKGRLDVDGVANAATLNALEIAMANQHSNNLHWQSAVTKAKA